jgi:hypothetical protein
MRAVQLSRAVKGILMSAASTFLAPYQVGVLS